MVSARLPTAAGMPEVADNDGIRVTHHIDDDPWKRGRGQFPEPFPISPQRHSRIREIGQDFHPTSDGLSATLIELGQLAGRFRGPVDSRHLLLLCGQPLEDLVVWGDPAGIDIHHGPSEPLPAIPTALFL